MDANNENVVDVEVTEMTGPERDWMAVAKTTAIVGCAGSTIGTGVLVSALPTSFGLVAVDPSTVAGIFGVSFLAGLVVGLAQEEKRLKPLRERFNEHRVAAQQAA